MKNRFRSAKRKKHWWSWLVCWLVGHVHDVTPMGVFCARCHKWLWLGGWQ